MTTTSASSIASTTPGAGRDSSAPSKRTPSTRSACRRRTNHSWKSSSPSAVWIFVRRRSSVAGRRRTPTPRPSGELLGHRGERLAFLQQSRAQHVEARVLVAEREPGLSPRLLGHRHRLIRVAAHAPSALLVEEAGQRVHDRVEVRGDVQIPHLQVVADVPDRGHVLGLGRDVQARGRTASRRDPRPTRLSSRRAGGRPGEGPRRREDAPGAPARARRANAARARHARAGSRRRAPGRRASPERYS